jgi:SAM-dependent methyltransferase
MATLDEMRQQVVQQAQGAMGLGLAFVGVHNGLFEALVEPATAEALAARAAVDAGYARRWCEAAFAFGYLDADGEVFRLTELGDAFRPSAPGTLMPFAVQSVLGAHMAERAAGLMPSGERPGERVLAERATILPWFGPMLEASFAGFFEREILPRVEVYAALDAAGGVAVDLGCGNGWYLRALARRFAGVRGVGLDGFEENVRQATGAAARDGLAARLTFRAGDLHRYTVDEPADLIAMNRALHHVWDRRDEVFAKLSTALRPGGSVVIWEPRWPDDLGALRDGRRRAMAFQNLSEHVQGNHFLRPAEIEGAMRAAGLAPTTQLFADGTEAVVVGTRPR